MRVLSLIFLILLSCINKVVAQKSGEEITYNSERGIYYVKYWSVGDSTFYTIPLFPGNKIEPKVKATVSIVNGTYIYEYSVTNKETSLREIYSFAIPLEAKIQSLKSPNGEWAGNIVRWTKLVRWIQSNSDSDTLGILPGSNVDGNFLIKSESLPSITKAQVSSFWGLGNSKDEGPTGELRIKIDSLLEHSRYIEVKTIAPQELSGNVSKASLLDSLQSYLSFSCDTTWIENQGTCRSLKAKLDNLEKQLERGNTKTATNNLQAFLNQLNALKEKQISSEAYALLYFNGDFLLGRLK